MEHWNCDPDGGKARLMIDAVPQFKSKPVESAPFYSTGGRKLRVAMLCNPLSPADHALGRLPVCRHTKLLVRQQQHKHAPQRWEQLPSIAHSAPYQPSPTLQPTCFYDHHHHRLLPLSPTLPCCAQSLTLVRLWFTLTPLLCGVWLTTTLRGTTLMRHHSWLSSTRTTGAATSHAATGGPMTTSTGRQAGRQGISHMFDAESAHPV